MKILNKMDVGMHPLNWAAQISKIATDVMFGLAVNDEASTIVRLDQIDKAVKELRKAISNAPDEGHA